MIKRLLVIYLGINILICNSSEAQETQSINIAVIHQRHTRDTISITDIPPADDVISGALMGAADNNTTGKFTGQNFSITDIATDEIPNFEDIAQSISKQNISFIIADLPQQILVKLSTLIDSKNGVIFNITATDDDLRNEECLSNVIHTTPSRSMLSDAVAQYLVWKQWKRWVLIKGSHPEDQLLGSAYIKSAKKYGAKIVDEKVYEDTGGARRTDSGHVQTQRQIPLFTQSLPPHDVIIAADEHDVFAGYLRYRTSAPDIITGSSGLVPTSWDATHEQWGAIQLQNRFIKSYKRTMNHRDANAWLAVRMIGEAASRVQSTDSSKIIDFLFSKDFSIAAFKGTKLTIRDWDHQVRQPILLSDGKTIVSSSPQDGFLHQLTELDTLGTDKPESKCHF